MLALFLNHRLCIPATGSEKSASCYTLLKGIMMMVDGSKNCQTCPRIHWSVIGQSLVAQRCFPTVVQNHLLTNQSLPWTSDCCCSGIDSIRVENCTERQHIKATSPHLILAYTTRCQTQTQLLVPPLYSPRKLFASSQDTVLPLPLDPIG